MMISPLIKQNNGIVKCLFIQNRQRAQSRLLCAYTNVEKTFVFITSQLMVQGNRALSCSVMRFYHFVQIHPNEGRLDRKCW